MLKRVINLIIDSAEKLVKLFENSYCSANEHEWKQKQ